jgi:hypothetical protein
MARAVTLNDIEVEIVRVVRAWRDEILTDDPDSKVADIDAGDAAKLAAAIISKVIMPGVAIVGPLEARRPLSDGWK